MTDPIAKPKLGIEAPLPNYNRPGVAVQEAVDGLPAASKTNMFIDTDKWNEVAWKVVEYSHNKPATRNQIIDECSEINKAAWNLVTLLSKASTPTKNALDKRVINYGLTSNDRRFDFAGAQFAIGGLVEATEKATRAIENGDTPAGLKGKGQAACNVVDEIGDMIASEYRRQTLKFPSLNRPLGHNNEPQGRILSFLDTYSSQYFQAVIMRPPPVKRQRDGKRRTNILWKNRHQKESLCFHKEIIELRVLCGRYCVP
jgi:hypothetical protein